MDETMKTCKQRVAGSDIYALIRQARMSELDRQVAIKAMRDAEAIADAMVWVKEKVAALGNCLLKPSLKH